MYNSKKGRSYVLRVSEKKKKGTDFESCDRKRVHYSTTRDSM